MYTHIYIYTYIYIYVYIYIYTYTHTYVMSGLCYFKSRVEPPPGCSQLHLRQYDSKVGHGVFPQVLVVAVVLLLKADHVQNSSS